MKKVWGIFVGKVVLAEKCKFKVYRWVFGKVKSEYGWKGVSKGGRVIIWG